ncbi:MAG: hypothetical protein GX490_03720 [Bacilli bacterium]|nr:hypothetical protein [Bacilli bacterium]
MELDVKLLMEIYGLINEFKKTYYLLKNKHNKPYSHRNYNRTSKRMIKPTRSNWDRFWLG